MSSPAAGPVHIDSGGASVFGVHHPAAGGSTAVLLCAPWGWDEVASYRARKRWAERLAAAGHATLRFDLPAVGDSSGAPEDLDLVEAWVGAVAAGVEFLRACGAERIAALGLGLGGILAREAAARGAAIDELALWGAPAAGKSLAREIRAFSRLQLWKETEGSTLPPGAIEAGGFVLSEPTLTALKALDPEPGAGLRRCLLLDRDGVAADEALRERFVDGGVEVETAAGPGWGLLVSHPERSRLDAGTAATVEDWLAKGAPAPLDRDDLGPGVAETTVSWPPVRLRIELDGAAVEERPHFVEHAFGRSFGILATPAAPAARDLCAVFCNAGAVRHSGPDRLWVETARRWAAAGTPSLRIDLEGIGEADGDETRFSDVGEFYIPEFERQLVTVLDALDAEGVASRFVLVGLCAGGYWSFQAATGDARVAAAVLLNAGALNWREGILEQRDARRADDIFDRGAWRKVVRGERSRPRPRRVLKVAAAWARRPGGGGEESGGAAIEADLDRIRDLGPRLVMAFSGNEPLRDELAAEGILDQLDRWPNLELHQLPGEDHTLRPLAAQRAAAVLLDRERTRV